MAMMASMDDGYTNAPHDGSDHDPRGVFMLSPSLELMLLMLSRDFNQCYHITLTNYLRLNI